MRVGLWGMAAVFLGAFAAHFLLRDRGYVLINFAGYAVEMSVPALVVLLVAAYAGIRALFALWRAPRRLGKAPLVWHGDAYHGSPRFCAHKKTAARRVRQAAAEGLVGSALHVQRTPPPRPVGP